jgi:hypothetical protein
MSRWTPGRDDQAVTVLGWLRVGLGVLALVAPSAPARPWVGRDATRPSVKTLARALGARDLALGLGTVLARRHGAPLRGWLEGSALADAGDAVATLIGWRTRPSLGRLAVLAAASGGAISCGLLARRVPG